MNDLYVPPSYDDDSEATAEPEGEVHHVFASDSATAVDEGPPAAAPADENAVTELTEEEQLRESGYDFSGEPPEPTCEAMFFVIVGLDGRALAFADPGLLQGQTPRRDADFPTMAAACAEVLEDLRVSRIVQSVVGTLVSTTQQLAAQQEAQQLGAAAMAGRLPMPGGNREQRRRR